MTDEEIAEERVKAFDEQQWRRLLESLCFRDPYHQGIISSAALARYDALRARWATTLHQSDLLEPWTPRLILHLDHLVRLVEHYPQWDREGDPSSRLPVRFGWGAEVHEDHRATVGEQVFALILADFQEAGLGRATQVITNGRFLSWNWVSFIESRRARYRKRVGWLHAKVPWTPFQVDINSPSLFLDVTGPDVWQVIVDEFCDEPSGRDIWAFLQNMQMASLAYIEKSIPGPHDDPDRLHEPTSPKGYGTSMTIPSFGYRREHRSEHRLAGWAAVHGMDLFNPALWASTT